MANRAGTPSLKVTFLFGARMGKPLLRSAVPVVFSTFLSSCGTTLPIMDLQHPRSDEFSQFVKAIAGHVRCEMRFAVAREYDPHEVNRKVLYNWAARVALTIRAKDQGNLNPSVSLINKAATFTAGLGGQFEADGTREMTMTYFLPFDELLQLRKEIDLTGRNLDCSKLEFQDGTKEPIEGSLGVHESLQAAIESWDGFGTLSEHIKGGPFDTITHHVTFVVTNGGSVTPSWKFATVTANQGTPFLMATRTSTDDLLITMGPTTLGTRKEVVSPALDESFSIERLKTVTVTR